jgi:hypothetical protein
MDILDSFDEGGLATLPCAMIFCVLEILAFKTTNRTGQIRAIVYGTIIVIAAEGKRR